jgi:hypothetical protein
MCTLFMTQLTMASVFGQISELQRQRAFKSFAIAPRLAYLFYAEPVCTFTLQVFVNGPSAEWTPFIPTMMHGVPVVFATASTNLEIEAVENAAQHNYDGENVTVVSAEYLVALAFNARDLSMIRAITMIEDDLVDLQKLATICDAHGINVDVGGPAASTIDANPEIQRIFEGKKAWHHDQARLPVVDKMRIMLAIQGMDYPILEKRGVLKPWEKPWNVQP